MIGRASLLLAVAWLVTGCEDTPPVVCTGICVAPSFTKLDLVAGLPGGPGWVDAVGAAAHFTDPWTFASDGHGKLFLADSVLIREIDLATAAVTTLAGSGAIGGTDGPANGASFNGPSGLAYSDGELYVTDTENHTLRRIDVATGVVSTFSGAYGTPGTTDASGTDARFREPEGLALDGAGDLYIGDTDNNTIRKLVLANGAVSTIAGVAGTAGTSDGVADAALFNKPKALACDGTTLYVLDSGNSSIRTMSLADADVRTLATFPMLPLGIEVDGTDLLVSLSDHRIVRIDPAGTVTPIAGAVGMMGFVDGTGTAARFNRPAGMWNDRAGNVYVADESNTAIRKLSGTTITTYAGANPVGNTDGIGMTARFWLPQGVVVDSGGAAWVADTNNDTIRKVVLASGETTTLAGAAGQSGSADGTGAAARFAQPSSLALDDTAHVLYVADAGSGTIRRIDLASSAVTTLVIAQAPGEKDAFLSYPDGLALDGTRLLIADYMAHSVFALDLATSTLSVLAGTPNKQGTADGTGRAARLNGPGGIASDGHGALFVADVLNETIRKIDLATGAVSTIAGMVGVQGTMDGVGAAAGFAYPVAVAADAVGDVFVADSHNNSIRHVDAATGTVRTVIGGRPGVGIGPLPAQISQPTALALTPDGHLVVFSESSLLIAH